MGPSLSTHKFQNFEKKRTETQKIIQETCAQNFSSIGSSLKFPVFSTDLQPILGLGSSPPAHTNQIFEKPKNRDSENHPRNMCTKFQFNWIILKFLVFSTDLRPIWGLGPSLPAHTNQIFEKPKNRDSGNHPYSNSPIF